jgi:flagellin-like hook-associated protein FlgL
MSANLDALDTNLQALRSSAQDVDVEQAITQLMSRQTTLQAAMMTTSRVLTMSLTDYLK